MSPEKLLTELVKRYRKERESGESEATFQQILDSLGTDDVAKEEWEDETLADVFAMAIYKAGGWDLKERVERNAKEILEDYNLAMFVEEYHPSSLD